MQFVMVKYLHDGQYDKARDVFGMVGHMGLLPNHVTYTLLIRGAVRAGKLDDAMLLTDACQRSLMVQDSASKHFRDPETRHMHPVRRPQRVVVGG